MSSTSESTSSEFTYKSMPDLSELSVKNATKVFSNDTQTLQNSEHEEQYNLYKRQKLLQETGIFKTKLYLSFYIYKCFFFFKYCYKSKIDWVDLGEM